MSPGMITAGAMGTPLVRLDAAAKVTGTAPYAYEYHHDAPAYLHLVPATIARGRVREVRTVAAEGLDGVLTVLTPTSAPRLADTSDAELAVLQSDEVAFRGQIVAAVVAETPEVARHAAGLVHVTYDEQDHQVELRTDAEGLYAPEQVNPTFPTDTDDGDVEGAWQAAAVTIDETYTTPIEHNNPMEPHTTVARWDEATSVLTLWESAQGGYGVQGTVAPVLGLDPGQVRVINAYVGGGFGSKGMPHVPVVMAAMAAMALPGRAVKLAVTRQQMFSLVGYRTPTIQRLRLGADTDGRLTAITHEVWEQTSRIKEFAEQTAVATRLMYASPNRRTSHRLAPLDVPVPSWMRAPGEAPGMFALEVAMDELAVASGLDPIELRVRNEPASDPESGHPWSVRSLVECLRQGASSFGWEDRDPTPGARRHGDWLVGTGVAGSTYPYLAMPGSRAAIAHLGRGLYAVRIAATDIGTGARTALTQIAADALGIGVDQVRLELGDTDLPMGTVAGGSAGTSSWGSTITAAARVFRSEHGTTPPVGAETTAEMPDAPDIGEWAIHSFGAQFAEVRVHADTGEIRVPRLLGVFSVGRVINPRTTRSQLIGGMTMGLSMALHEESVVDRRFGHVVTHNLADYHVATNADVGAVDVAWLDEVDPHANPMGSRGVGEIGIVGAAAAVVNAAHHATGVRVRELPATADRFLI